MQLRPMKRRGNRRYYQHHEVLMIRKIRDLLYDQGFTISGARNKLLEVAGTDSDNSNKHSTENVAHDFSGSINFENLQFDLETQHAELPSDLLAIQSLKVLRLELFEIRDLLKVNS